MLLATADEDDVEIFQMKSTGLLKILQKLVWIQQKYLETRCRGFSKKNRPRRRF
jgi:hypothetical protein